MTNTRHYLVDANILLRFLVGEPAGHANAARNLMARAQAGEIVLHVSPVIVAETIYTLLSFYSVERKAAAEKLSLLLQQRGVKLRDASQVLGGLARLQTTNVDFADAYLAAGAAEESLPIASFDRDFDKFKDVTRYEPSV